MEPAPAQTWPELYRAMMEEATRTLKTPRPKLSRKEEARFLLDLIERVQDARPDLVSEGELLQASNIAKRMFERAEEAEAEAEAEGAVFPAPVDPNGYETIEEAQVANLVSHGMPFEEALAVVQRLGEEESEAAP